MKFKFTLFCGLAFTLAANAQTNVANVSKNNVNNLQQAKAVPTAAIQQTSFPADALVLKEAEFDFGKIPQGKPVTHVFEFTNTSSVPFSLDNVQASCGCTTPEWSKEPIAPGATSQIKVGYNAASPTAFTKDITIRLAGLQDAKVIHITGEVLPVEAYDAYTKTDEYKKTEAAKAKQSKSDKTSKKNSKKSSTSTK